MRRIAVVLVLLFSPLLATAQRLPGTVTPHHYDLSFEPDLTTFTFAGTAGIDVSVNEPTDTIVMHAVELELDEVIVVSQGERVAATPSFRPDAEMVDLKLARPIEPGPARIEIDYRGTINDKLRGFYRGHFPDGTPYAATQLESTSARQMFPSFDEPEFKATFRIAAEVADDLMVVSNSPIESESAAGEGRRRVQFETTPRMSTYLVAMVVGTFATIDDEFDGIPLRIIAAPDKIAMGRYAMEATKVVLRWMQDYYGVPYPFAKLDQIAIPDFQAGAMENSGAILYRETALLVDDETASESSRRYVASVVAHEIAHQWFGDLVTMNWWDDIWLNEGFASFMEDKPLEEWQPEWDVPTRVVAGMSWALSADALPTTRPIRARAETSAEIDAMFDGISYSKGSALLRMLESWVGPETFRDGVRLYLRRHAWRNTGSADLAAALADVSDLPVARVLNDFVTRAGIPLVSVISACEDGNTRLYLRQRRFVADPASMRAADDTVWSIPVCLESESGRRCVLLEKAAESFTLPGCGAVWANDAGSGYYVTRYGGETLESFVGEGGPGLSPAERLVLLRDAWLQVRADILGVDEYLTLVSSFRDERHRAVVSEILGRLDTIDSQLVPDAQRDEWEAWLREWLSPLVAELGWSPRAGESSETRSLRASVLSVMAGMAADEATRRTARQMAEAWLEDPAAIDPELASTVLMAAARSGDEELFEMYTRALRETPNPSHRSSLLVARTQFPSAAIHQRLMEETLTDAVRVQDVDRTLRSLMSNPESREATWNFIRTRWDELGERLPPSDLPGLIGRASVLCTREGLAELDAHVEEHAVDEQSRAVRQARERITGCLEFHDLQAERFSEWLREQD